MKSGINSFRFLSGITRRIMKIWAGFEDPREIPWAPLNKPLSECRIAMISSAGLALKSDKPFDQAGERANPWWGDPSSRVLPSYTNCDDVEVYHLHINPDNARLDLNCILPLTRLHELAKEGFIGEVAASHYTFMGFILNPETLLKETVPAIVRQLKQEQVDAVLLVPV